MKQQFLIMLLLVLAVAGCEDKTKQDESGATAGEAATEPAIQEGTQGLKAAKKAGAEIENKAADRLKAVDEAAEP